MRRSAKPAKTKDEAKLSVSRTASKNKGARARDLERRLAGSLKRESEASERQAATAKILGSSVARRQTPSRYSIPSQ